MSISILSGYYGYRRSVPAKVKLKSILTSPAPPRSGITLACLDTQRALISHVYRREQAKGRQVVRIEVKLELGEKQNTSRPDLPDLSQLTMLHLGFIKKRLREYIADHLIDYQRKRKGRGKQIYVDPREAVKYHPDLLDKLLKEPTFSHIRMVIWQPERVEREKPGSIQVATLPDTRHIISATAVNARTRVLL